MEARALVRWRRDLKCFRLADWRLRVCPLDSDGLVLDAALADPAFPSGNEGLYFGENEFCEAIDVARAYTKALYDAGKSRTEEPEPFTAEDLSGDLSFVRRLY